MDKKSILVIDDERINLSILGAMLVDDYELMVTKSVYTARELIQENQPDLILLDVVMPDINGIEFAQSLRQDTNTQHLPIIFISADTSENTKNSAQAVGNCYYLSKPIHKALLLKAVQSLLKD
ncbi:response regulator [Thiomicrorhabdus sp. 6S2-11]|jgi:CheY-like chemotaxis protein|uniref:Response regulator n=1 Tax=Thiomicrorhabdus marina TaxID=2818442 RepID=A0ABS3Q3K1_9GAMM|nr:response regulator [Thiomicrorhabdus marina]MBO1926915.1 response regulator [Thiomicrorhabdus marina]